MPTSDKLPEVVVDTSAAVPLIVADHDHHEMVFGALADRHVGLAGHAAFETYSVLTRLPPPTRLTPAAAARLLKANFPASIYLSSKAAAETFRSLHELGIAGGSVYDALVGAAAKEHGIVLATVDRRAIQTYRALDIDYELVADTQPQPSDST